MVFVPHRMLHFDRLLNNYDRGHDTFYSYEKNAWGVREWCYIVNFVRVLALLLITLEGTLTKGLS